MTPARPARWKPLITGAIVALGLLATGIAQTSGGRQILKQAGLYASSAPFTEIYFPNPAELRVPARRHHRLHRVVFVIRNEEHESMSYMWSIGLASSPALRTGRTVLGVKQQTTVTRMVPVACSGSRVRVEVRLLKPPETIGYWEHCHS